MLNLHYLRTTLYLNTVVTMQRLTWFSNKLRVLYVHIDTFSSKPIYPSFFATTLRLMRQNSMSAEKN